MDFPFILLTIIAFGLLTALISTARRARQYKSQIAELSQRAHDRQALDARVRRLATREETITGLIEAAYNALLLVDSDHQVISINAAARELFTPTAGWREGGESLISMTRHHELDDLVAAALHSSDEPMTQQITIHMHPYRVRMACIESTNGPYVAIALEDVSELQRLGRARREMVGNISHELRTPITSIRLLVDTLLRGAIRDAAKATPMVEKISVETGTLQQMAQELLDLAMIESGRAEFRLLPVSMRDVAQDALGRLAEMVERNHLSVDNRIGADLRVLADSEQVARVLTNLLHNAIKFTPSGGAIVIDAKADPEWTTIMMTDSGPGIPIIERERVFERFYRADRARQGGGTGLGLAIAKHIVEAHGGRIWAGEPPLEDSAAGAHLCFTLPIADRSS
jgi:two-component system, OmpR family, phosphate regulon sensor histidine kinase PhoR